MNVALSGSSDIKKTYLDHVIDKLYQEEGLILELNGRMDFILKKFRGSIEIEGDDEKTNSSPESISEKIDFLQSGLDSKLYHLSKQMEELESLI